MFTIVFLLVATTCLYRLHVSLKRRPCSFSDAPPPHTRSLAVFLGSGGHTSEVLQLLSALDFVRYTPRTYIISDGDHLSAQKAVALEQTKASSNLMPNTVQDYFIITIPRARRVHQSLFTTPFSSLWSLLVCIYYLTVEPVISPQSRPTLLTDVLVLNGPGTCASLCIAIIFNRFLGLHSPRVIYVESFARVRSLSVSARLLRPLVDRFFVQWRELLQDKGHGEYAGWLI